MLAILVPVMGVDVCSLWRRSGKPRDLVREGHAHRSGDDAVRGER